MINVDPMQQFTKDKVKICMGIAASYLGAKLIAGGTMTTGIQNPSVYYPEPKLDDDGLPIIKICTENQVTDCVRLVPGGYKLTGPLLNTSLAFG